VARVLCKKAGGGIDVLSGVRAPSEESVDSHDGFDALYSASFQRLALQLYAYLGDLSEAQDLVQEAFFRAFTRWRRVRAYDDPEAWVRRVALNLAASHFRRQRTAAGYLSGQREEAAPEPSPDHVALVRALAGIAAPQRRAVVLHYLAGMTVPEIAEHEAAAEGTVRSWLARGRAALAAQLQERKVN
jgi:RNA polymerase sigma-70 factor, ECF subfamily